MSKFFDIKLQDAIERINANFRWGALTTLSNSIGHELWLYLEIGLLLTMEGISR